MIYKRFVMPAEWDEPSGCGVWRLNRQSSSATFLNLRRELLGGEDSIVEVGFGEDVSDSTYSDDMQISSLCTCGLRLPIEKHPFLRTATTNSSGPIRVQHGR